jgi:hypothetical protein
VSSCIGFIIRFQGDQAIIQKNDYSIVSIPRSELPAHVREGDFVVEMASTHEYKVDYTLTQLRNQEIRRMTVYYFD